jgi:peptide/nickel transport system permease protein
MVLVFNFFLFRVVDRDPLARYRGRSKLSQEQRAAIIHRFGLDGSKWDQFVQYISHTLRGDFGRSFDTTKPVGQEILAALPNTLLLVGISTVLTIGIGLWIGIRAGWRRGSTFDKVSTPATMALYGTPEFFLGMLFLAFFGARLGWFPTGGSVDPAGSYTGFAAIVDRARHLVLPVATLTLGYLGSYSLVMRTSMLDTLREDYLTTARAKGLRDNDVMRRHAVPNALLPSVSLIAIGFGFIIGGAITTETVFSYPGLGLETYQAIGNNDLPMMQALFMFSSIAVIVFNIGADMVLTILDPRIRVGG